MCRQAVAVWVFVLALGAAGTAAAQQEPQRGKVNVFLRGGVGNYTGELGESFEVGPSWGLTLNVQPCASSASSWATRAPGTPVRRCC
jgi:hypothetical protein